MSIAAQIALDAFPCQHGPLSCFLFSCHVALYSEICVLPVVSFLFDACRLRL